MMDACSPGRSPLQIDLGTLVPFYLHIDASFRLLNCGPSLRKLLPGLQPGESITPHLDWRRPSEALQPAAWPGLQGKLCVLRSRSTPPVMLRGALWPQADGSLCLSCNAIITRQADMEALGFGLQDFAMHDPLGDMLILHQSMQMSQHDAIRNAERSRQRARELETVLALNPNGLASFSPEQLLLLANQAFATMVDCTRAELAQATLGEVSDRLQAMLAADERRQISQATLQAQPSPLQDRVLRWRDGRMIRFDLQHSQDDALVLRLIDVTREFELDRMKSEFLSTAAHELRTPLSSVHGFIELLQMSTQLPPRQREMLDIVHRQSERLITMVTDLLDLARIEAGEGQNLSLAAVNIHELMRDAAAAMQGSGDARPVDWQAPAAASSWALGDAAKLYQCLINVLSNAYKYSPQGGAICMGALHRDDEQGQGWVGLQVEDQGLGMSPEQLARVYERFYRADPSGHIPGTGLGMSLVKQLMEMQGGTIDIRSTLGQGTCVTLWVPACPAPADTIGVHDRSDLPTA